MSLKSNFRGPTSIETTSIADEKNTQRAVANTIKQKEQSGNAIASRPAVQRKFAETNQRKKTNGGGPLMAASGLVQMKETQERVPRSPACKDGEDITELMRELVEKGPGIIEKQRFPEEEEKIKLKVFKWVFQEEGIFHYLRMNFSACAQIEIPELEDARPAGDTAADKKSFSGYSNSRFSEIGGLNELKKNIELFLNNHYMEALLKVLKLVAHEKRHLTLWGAPFIDESDLNPGNGVKNPIEVSRYLIEEILVNAEEIDVHLNFKNGDYKIPNELILQLQDYWKRIKKIVSPEKAKEIRTHIRYQLMTRHRSKKYNNLIAYGVLHSMDTGIWSTKGIDRMFMF